MAWPKEIRIGPRALWPRPVAPGQETGKNSLGLLQSSRQLRQESRGILFRTSIIHISLEDSACYEAFLKWLDKIEDEHVSEIRDMRIYAWIQRHYGWDEMLSLSDTAAISFCNRRYNLKFNPESCSVTYSFSAMEPNEYVHFKPKDPHRAAHRADKPCLQMKFEAIIHKVFQRQGLGNRVECFFRAADIKTIRG